MPTVLYNRGAEFASVLRVAPRLLFLILLDFVAACLYLRFHRVRGVVAGVVRGAEGVGEGGVVFDVADYALDLVADRVGRGDVVEDGALIFGGDVDVADFEKPVRQPDAHADIGDVVEVHELEVDDDARAHDYALVGDGVADVFELKDRADYVCDPDPDGREVEREEQPDEPWHTVAYLRDHHPYEGDVERQPYEDDGQHLDHRRRDIRAAARLSAPKHGLALGDEVVDVVAVHFVAVKILFLFFHGFASGKL